MADPGTFAPLNVDVRPTHIRALNQIEGILACDTMKNHPSNPGRDFMCTNQIFDERLSVRYLNNGVVFNQCLYFFHEFMPNSLKTSPAAQDDKGYIREMYTLIRHEMDLEIDKLTVATVQRVADFWLELRTTHLDNNRQQTSLSNQAGETNRFLITLLDKRLMCIKADLSGAQLRFGMRKDDTFALRMATRVHQWRAKMQCPQDILFEFMEAETDILPPMEWTSEFKEMAREFAKRFKKPMPRFETTGSLARSSRLSDPGVEVKSEKDPDDTPKTKLIKHMSTKMSHIEDTCRRMADDITALKVGQDTGITRVMDGFSNIEVTQEGFERRQKTQLDAIEDNQEGFKRTQKKGLVSLNGSIETLRFDQVAQKNDIQKLTGTLEELKIDWSKKTKAQALARGQTQFGDRFRKPPTT